jgi:hypothetical protein
MAEYGIQASRTQNGYGINCRLPATAKDIFPVMHANERFRTVVMKGLEEIFTRWSFCFLTFIKVDFKSWGISIEVDGINTCCVYVLHGHPGEVCSHNIDNYEQFQALHLALSLYMNRFYMYCSGVPPESLGQMPRMEEGDRISERIDLRRCETQQELNRTRHELNEMRLEALH